MHSGALAHPAFGMYAVVQGLGAAVGNLAGGAALDLGRADGWPGLAWALMAAVGVAGAAGLTALDRAGQLRPVRATTPAALAAEPAPANTPVHGRP